MSYDLVHPGVCEFANAVGGRMLIGVKDDDDMEGDGNEL